MLSFHSSDDELNYKLKQFKLEGANGGLRERISVIRQFKLNLRHKTAQIKFFLLKGPPNCGQSH